MQRLGPSISSEFFAAWILVFGLMFVVASNSSDETVFVAASILAGNVSHLFVTSVFMAASNVMRFAGIGSVLVAASTFNFIEMDGSVLVPTSTFNSVEMDGSVLVAASTFNSASVFALILMFG